MIFTETQLRGAFIIDIERREDPRGMLQKMAAEVDAQSEGLPVGAQLVGRPWADAQVLAAMAAVEEEVSEGADFPRTPVIPQS